MAYSITYGQGGIRRRERKGKWIVAIVILLLVGAFRLSPWYEGAASLLLPGDSAVTAAAIEAFAQRISEGESVAQAWTCFCREIIENG